MSDPIYTAQAFEIAKMAESVKTLEAENTKLREQMTQLRDDWESERDYANQMEAKEEIAVTENAKLRIVCGNYMRRAYESAIEKGNQTMVEIIENEALILGIEIKK